MLWMKAWLEIRWKLAFALAIVVAPLFGSYLKSGASGAEAGIRLTLVSFLWLFVAVVLAGNGIRTQSPIQGTRGLHGSTHFTLSLPVSRFHLLSVRALMGLAAVMGIILVSSSIAWIFFAGIRSHSSVSDFIRWDFTLCCVAALFHAISILNSTWLDENLQIWGTMAAIGLVKVLTVWLPPPSSADPFRVMTDASPLLTHSLPLLVICVSLTLAAFVFLMAARIAQKVEY